MILRLFFLISFFSGVSLAAEPRPADVQTLRFVIIGDSLVEGYGVSRKQAFPALLEPKLKKLDSRWQVINAGISGSTSGSALGRVRWQLREPPDLLMLVLGANDGLRGLPVEAMKENLGKAIDAAKEQKVPVVLAGMQMPPNYTKEYREAFAKAFVELGKLSGVTLVPFLLEGVAGAKDLNLADGIHPNEKGHTKIANTVFKIIEPIVKNISQNKKPKK
jgi:acyl-CoA thioesterase-1